MEKFDYANRYEEGIVVAPDGSDAPIVIPDSPEAVRPGRLPEATGAARREGSLYPLGSEDLIAVENGRPKGKSTRNEHAKQPRILGLKRRTFFLVTLAALLVIGAVVGGAVGGTRASRKNATSTPPVPADNANETSSNTLASSTPSPTPSSPPVMPFKLQTWEDRGFKGRSQLFYTPGGYKTSFLARSYHWQPGPWAESEQLPCSLATCFNDNDNGWWGISERYWPGDYQNTSRGMMYVYVACRQDFADPKCPGPADAMTYTSVPVLETTSIDSTKTVPQPTESSTETASSTGTEITGSTIGAPRRIM